MEHRARFAALEDDRAQLEKARPVFPRAMGVRDGEMEDLPVLLRGDYLTPGGVTPRRFDFPDPSVPAGMRASTIVPAQALFLLNSDLVLENTLRFADRLLATEADDAARLDIAYRTVLCRTPSAEECARDLAGLDEYEEAWREETQRDGESDGKAAGARRLAWRSLLRELVASNELIFIE